MTAGRNWTRWAVFAAAAIVALTAIVQLERPRAGLVIEGMSVGTTPVTLYRRDDTPAPVVVVAHGFAGSRPLMQAFSLTLARAGYLVLAFDFEGHGKNPVPMSGDVTKVEGTTRLLVAETLRVAEAGRGLPWSDGRVALLGHSMASDIVVRAAREDPRIDTVVAVSMFSEAVTATEPRRLLMITGEWEGFLRSAAVAALRLVDPAAAEGDTATAGPVLRRAVVAPHVEHVGVLYSATSLTEARAWLDAAFGRPASEDPPPGIGLWLMALLASLLALAWPLAALLPDRHAPPVEVSPARFAAVILAPALLAPLIATQIRTSLLPVLVADYLVVHFAIQGALQIALLRWSGVGIGPFRPLATAALVGWGLLAFGAALNRYGASFWPIPERLPIIAALAIGALPYMLADAMATLGTGARLLRRLFVKAALLGSLALAVTIDLERLFFLIIILPVILLFFLIFGLMGRWVGLRAGPAAAGVALGLILAWSLGVSFPLFAAV